jgi:hypothetical protein
MSLSRCLGGEHRQVAPGPWSRRCFFPRPWGHMLGGEIRSKLHVLVPREATLPCPQRQCGRSELSVGDSDRHKVPGGGGGFLQNAPCTCGVCVGTVQTKQELGGLSRDQCGLMRSARALKFGGDAGLEVQNLSPGRTEPHCCTQIDWGARTLHVSL